MGMAKRVLIETEDGHRIDTWDDLPLVYEVTVQGDYVPNRATSWIRIKIGEDANDELRCIDESVDGVIYRGLYNTPQEAEAAIKELVDRARCSHRHGWS